MKEILEYVNSPAWWVSVVLVSFATSLGASYARRPLDRFLEYISKARAERARRKNSRLWKDIGYASRDPRIFNQSLVCCYAHSIIAFVCWGSSIILLAVAKDMDGRMAAWILNGVGIAFTYKAFRHQVVIKSVVGISKAVIDDHNKNDPWNSEADRPSNEHSKDSINTNRPAEQQA